MVAQKARSELQPGLHNGYITIDMTAHPKPTANHIHVMMYGADNQEPLISGMTIAKFPMMTAILLEMLYQ